MEEELYLSELIQQCTADSERWFPGSQSLPFLALCLAGETGEVANLLKKVQRGTHTLDADMRCKLAEEIVDVLIYLCNIMGHPDLEDVDWMSVWGDKRDFNEERFGKRLLNHPGSDRWTGGDKKDEL